MFAVLAVAIITLDRDNRLHHRQYFVNCSKAEWRAQARERLSFAVGHAHTTTDQYGEAS